MAEQMSMIEALVDPRLGRNQKLLEIDALIDWSRLEIIVLPLHQAETGRPAYPVLSMLKALYLQSLYELSDPGMEDALGDRLSFRKFCGFGLDQKTPDETTICRFRGDAARAHVLEKCFAEITRQLEAKGLMLKKGTLMDATIITSSHNPRKLKAEKGANHPKEVGAGWINKAGKSYFGYKLHIGIDQGSGLIRKAIFTTAHCQDSEVADGLISGDEKAVYADRAYENKHRRIALKAKGIKDRIMHRRHKHLPVLPAWQKKRNALISKRRAPVEAVFSAMKNIYGKGRARCYSLLVNAVDYFAFASIYNLRRAVIITK